MKAFPYFVFALALHFTSAQAIAETAKGDNESPPSNSSESPTITLTEKELAALIQAEIAKAIIQRETQPLYDKLDHAFGRKRDGK